MKKLIIALLLIILFAPAFCGEEKDEYLKGTIEKVENNIISVKIENKTEIFRIAPRWYILNNEYNFQIGDEIKIKYIEMNSMKHITEIVKGDKKYKFTDSNGEFLWHRKGWMENGEGMNRGHGEGRHNGKGKTK